jgi:hypothetical protein
VRYWWVNQNQTFRHKSAGGYLWSPKRNANGAKNPFYGDAAHSVKPLEQLLCAMLGNTPAAIRRIERS